MSISRTLVLTLGLSGNDLKETYESDLTQDKFDLLQRIFAAASSVALCYDLAEAIRLAPQVANDTRALIAELVSDTPLQRVLARHQSTLGMFDLISANIVFGEPVVTFAYWNKRRCVGSFTAHNPQRLL